MTLRRAHAVENTGLDGRSTTGRPVLGKKAAHGISFIYRAFAGVARLGLALAGAQWPCLRPWPSLEPGYAEQKTTPPPGPGETRLGFVSPELGCARRSRGDFGWRRGGSRETVKLPSRACRGTGSQIRRALAPIRLAYKSAPGRHGSPSFSPRSGHLLPPS